MIPGGDITLTIDAAIQKYTEDAVKEVFEAQDAEAAVAVVLSPKTGEILAMSTYPAFTQQEVTRYYQNAATLGRVPAFPGLQNRAVALPYEPGSTLKAITVAAAMQEKIVSAQSYSFYCMGKQTIGPDTIHCALHAPFESGHGDTSLTSLLQNSCNLATADCGFKLGRDKLYEYEQRFGLTQLPQSGMPGESRGQLNAANKWSKLKLANVSFGQGISATPLQVAAAYGVLANGGTYRHPHVIKTIETSDREGQKQLKSLRYGRDAWKVISPEVAQSVVKMMEVAVERGTGRKAELSDYTVAGKTGTAQIAEGGRYNGKYVASFAGMTPVSKPEIVILVAVTDPKKGHYGGEVAAPVFRKIAGQSLPYLGIAPDKKPRQKSDTSQLPTSFAE
jgi:stage V sporulation protein D (sporulation-specific penicillin-binding protein)